MSNSVIFVCRMPENVNFISQIVVISVPGLGGKPGLSIYKIFKENQFLLPFGTNMILVEDNINTTV